MNPDTITSQIGEINRLHEVVVRCTAESRTALNAALTAAWQAGRLLQAEHERINRALLKGGWSRWVRKNFKGSLRTAYRYMRLAETLTDVTFVGGLSLRQAYFRLGIATEPKKARQHEVSALPDYVRLATRLVSALRRRPPRGKNAAALAESYRRDLRVLYEQLQPLFGSANQTPARVSKGP
jgi:hypothetical protein